MELEIRELPKEEKQKYNTRLESYNTELKRLKKDYTRTLKKRQRSILLGGNDDDVTMSDPSLNPQDRYDDVLNVILTFRHDVYTFRLLDNTERLDRSSRKLEMSHKMLLETESAGAEVLNDLAQQRETLTRSRNRVSKFFFDSHFQFTEFFIIFFFAAP